MGELTKKLNTLDDSAEQSERHAASIKDIMKTLDDIANAEVKEKLVKRKKKPKVTAEKSDTDSNTTPDLQAKFGMGMQKIFQNYNKNKQLFGAPSQKKEDEKDKEDGAKDVAKAKMAEDLRGRKHMSTSSSSDENIQIRLEGKNTGEQLG